MLYIGPRRQQSLWLPRSLGRMTYDEWMKNRVSLNKWPLISLGLLQGYKASLGRKVLWEMLILPKGWSWAAASSRGCCGVTLQVCNSLLQRQPSENSPPMRSSPAVKLILFPNVKPDFSLNCENPSKTTVKIPWLVVLKKKKIWQGLNLAITK